jgi:hypothetical protein
MEVPLYFSQHYPFFFSLFVHHHSITFKELVQYIKNTIEEAQIIEASNPLHYFKKVARTCGKFLPGCKAIESADFLKFFCLVFEFTRLFYNFANLDYFLLEEFFHPKNQPASPLPQNNTPPAKVIIDPG